MLVFLEVDISPESAARLCQIPRENYTDKKGRMPGSTPIARGRVRVGRLLVKGSTRTIPKYPGFTPIVIHTEKYNKYSCLSPYVLKNARGEIMENIWHARKVWPRVPAMRAKKSQWSKEIIWEHPAETHVDDKNEPLPAYFKWSAKLLANPHAVRYPAGRKDARNTLYSLVDGKKLSYVEARKQVYLPEYVALAKGQPEFDKLRNRLAEGENLLIVEVDGPVQESLAYYKDKYGVPDDWIEGNSIEATEGNMKIMLNDEKHPFGHGYCLASGLQGFDTSKWD